MKRGPHASGGGRLTRPALYAALLAVAAAAWFFTRAPAHPPRTRVAVFSEPGFPAVGAPADLTPQALADALETTCDVQLLDTRGLAQLPRLRIDLLVMPYGEAFPVEGYPAICEYLLSGGGLMTVAGVPFRAPVQLLSGRWTRLPSGPAAFEQYAAPLGIKYYEAESAAGPLRACALEPDLLEGSLPPMLLSGRQAGLCVTTSQGRFVIQPTKGNTFAERVPCRDFLPLAGASPTGSDDPAVTGLLLVKAWENPYRTGGPVPRKWLLCSWSGDPHPFSPRRPEFRNTLQALLRCFEFPILIRRVQPGRPCYTDGEDPSVTVRLVNASALRTSGRLRVDLLPYESDTPVWTWETDCALAGRREGLVSVRIPGERLARKHDLWQVRCTLWAGHHAVDTAQTALVMRRTPYPLAIEVRDASFTLNARPTALLGANYYESRLGELQWIAPDLLNVARDFDQMHRLGLNIVRIHYHHPGWFADQARVLGRKLLLSLLPRNEAFARDAVPGEDFLRILDAHILLANRFGLVFCADLFSLVPESLGSCQGWMGSRAVVSDPARLALQTRFVQALAERYRTTPGITWDLWNEPSLPNGDLPALRAWVQTLTAAFRDSGDRHPITLGGNESLQLGDVLDYVSVHTANPAGCAVAPDLRKPLLFQEVWLEAGSSFEQEQEQAQKLEEAFRAALARGGKGFMPWQWTRQARLWDCFSKDERWDDELGCCVREDGTLKPAGARFRELIAETNALRLPAPAINGVDRNSRS